MAINENGDHGRNDETKNDTNASGTPISPRKLAANQRNAQRSTGPRTDAGKARSAQNSYKHGFFAAKLFVGDERAGAEGQETTELGKQICAYYEPAGYMEEMLVEKIVCESVRYGRLLGYEHEEFGRPHAFFGRAVDSVLRYQSAVNRQLFQAIKQLEDHQAKRKAQRGRPEPQDWCNGREKSEPTGTGDGVRPQETDSCSDV